MYRDAINGPKNRQFIHSSKCTFHNLCKVPLGTFSSDAGTELSNSWPKCCSVSFDNSAFLEADNLSARILWHSDARDTGQWCKNTRDLKSIRIKQINQGFYFLAMYGTVQWCDSLLVWKTLRIEFLGPLLWERFVPFGWRKVGVVISLVAVVFNGC